MKIRAALIPGKGMDFLIEEVDLDEPRSDEVLVRIVSSGICHTDLSFRDRGLKPMPAVLGHEGAGVVEKIGDGVKNVVPGDHVVLSYDSCGHCDNCIKGHPSYCRGTMTMNFGGTRRDGSHTIHKNEAPLYGAFFNQSSFADHALASERNVVKVPKDVPLEILGPLGCGVQTGAGTVMNAIHPPAGSTIAIFGTGSVGLSSLLGAVLCGCTTIIGVDVVQSRLDLALELGATHVVNSSLKDPVREIRSITGYGTDYSVETTGVPVVYRSALESLDYMGTCAFVAGTPPGTRVEFETGSILFGRGTKGVIQGDSIPHIFIPQMIDLYRQGRFPFDKLITFYAFESINKAVEDSKKGVAVKPVLRF